MTRSEIEENPPDKPRGRQRPQTKGKTNVSLNSTSTGEESAPGVVEGRGQPTQTNPQGSSPNPTQGHQTGRTAHLSLKEIAEHLATIETILQTPENAAKTRSIPTTKFFISVRGLLAKAEHLSHSNNLCTKADVKQLLQPLEGEIQKLQASRTALATAEPPQRTWAQTAAAGLTLKPIQTPAAPELTLRIPAKEDREKIQQWSNETIVNKIKGSQTEASKCVIAVQRLRSGDLKVFTTTTQARNELLRDLAWTASLNINANPGRKLFQVLVHNVRVEGVDVSDKDTAQKIQAQNAIRIPNLQVQKISWLRKNLPEGKKHSTLLLSVTEATAANQAIRQGIVYSGALHLVQLHSTAFTIVQCFKCQAYGHIAPHCRASETCGHCAGEHPSGKCPEGTNPKCANCKQNHKAWNNSCPTRRAQKAKAAAARFNAATTHEEISSPDPTGLQNKEPGWTFVGSQNSATNQYPKKKRIIAPKRGRPRDMDRSPSPRQQRLSMAPATATPTQPLQQEMDTDSE
jgi:hypothetical protein